MFKKSISSKMFFNALSLCIVSFFALCSAQVRADSPAWPSRTQAAGSFTQGVYRPVEPIKVPEGLTLEQVRSAVINGALKRNWLVTPSENQTFMVSYTKNDPGKAYVIVLMVEYTASEVKINYVSSDNLQYVLQSDGSILLHKNAIRWVSNLRIDINNSLQQIVLLGEVAK